MKTTPFRFFAICLPLGLLLTATGVQANERDDAQNEKIRALEKRIEALEKKEKKPTRPPPPKQTKAYDIPLDDSPVLGAKNAKVQVTIYMGYQCHWSSRLFPLLSDMVNDKQLRKQVKIVFKHFPMSFHVNSRPAAHAALAAKEQGKFWEMSKVLFENYKALKSENFEKYAGEAGLDVKKFLRDLKEKTREFDATIDRDKLAGEKKFGVRGTPELYVAGWKLKNRTVDGVKELIKERGLVK